MKSNELYRKLIKAGWYEVRQTGSHITMRHPTNPQIIIFTAHGSKEVATGLASSILKIAGLK